MSRSSRKQVHLVTQARTSKSDDIGYRERRYLIMMGIRVACFLLAILMVTQGAGWLAAFPAVGALVIPYFAVVFANGGREPTNTRGFREYEPNLPEPHPAPAAGDRAHPQDVVISNPQQPEAAGTPSAGPGTAPPPGVALIFLAFPAQLRHGWRYPPADDGPAPPRRPPLPGNAPTRPRRGSTAPGRGFSTRPVPRAAVLLPASQGASGSRRGRRFRPAAAGLPHPRPGRPPPADKQNRPRPANSGHVSRALPRRFSVVPGSGLRNMPGSSRN